MKYDSHSHFPLVLESKDNSPQGEILVYLDAAEVYQQMHIRTINYNMSNTRKKSKANIYISIIVVYT